MPSVVASYSVRGATAKFTTSRSSTDDYASHDLALAVRGLLNPLITRPGEQDGRMKVRMPPAPRQHLVRYYGWYGNRARGARKEHGGG